MSHGASINLIEHMRRPGPSLLDPYNEMETQLLHFFRNNYLNEKKLHCAASFRREIIITQVKKKEIFNTSLLPF